MSENIVAIKVPQQFQPYVKQVGNKDISIDSEKEAEQAAVLYSRNNPFIYRDFLNYLEKAGYASLHIQELAVEAAVKKGIWCIKNDEAEKGAFILMQHALNPDTPLELKAKMVEPLSKALLSDNISARKEAVFALNGLISTSILSKDKAKMLDSHYIALKDDDAYVQEWTAKNLTLLAIPAFAHLTTTQKISITWHFLDRLDKGVANLDVKKWIIYGLEELAVSEIPQRYKDCINRNLTKIRG